MSDMKDGFVRVAAGTPKVRVADCAYNTENGRFVVVARKTAS